MKTMKYHEYIQLKLTGKSPEIKKDECLISFEENGEMMIKTEKTVITELQKRIIDDIISSSLCPEILYREEKLNN